VLNSTSISLCLKNELKIFPSKKIYEKGGPTIDEQFLSFLPCHYKDHHASTQNQSASHAVRRQSILKAHSTPFSSDPFAITSMGTLQSIESS